ncbi:MAG: FAD-binding protein [Dehalococcoidia bacterium]|jgi:succinate dehydrogenase/fumarate reductase flavoprotein subunit|nr:FAD-binding protein [Dehalococcoidia bacterium]MDP7084720.1 FAD-binding protein [Dehalococcoidia bacterium]MDP7201389.1 FAD-binding protein [Dehalococcoidia bacterium]MDP7511937.1 FAD-binding protein [Dehalococcoidia bacterium]HJN88177.1 FAD-binding protein [Dehalococcoidia bacterium]
MVIRRQTDVVVVGGGMAGLCASLAALENHANVITLEKGSRSGGSMKLSGGLIWTFTSKALLREMMPDGNIDLQDMVLDDLWEGISWLEGHGVKLEAERDFMGHGRGRAANAHDLNAVLESRVQALGGEVELESPMDSLLHEDGEVRGVRVFSRSGIVDIEAGAVVLATGGFQGNPELLARYVTPHVDKVYLRSNPWSTGDGFLAATGIGAAATSSMSTFYGHSLPAPPASFGPKEFMEMTQRYGPAAVAINLDGRRFTDESAGTGEERLNHAIALQRDATAVYVVDAEIADAPLQYGQRARVSLERVRRAGGPVMEHKSLEELCEGLEGWGVAGGNALLTLREYNKSLAGRSWAGQSQVGGLQDRLDPPRRGNRFPIAKPPFSAVMVRPGVTFTTGGLEVDTELRVLRRSSSISTLPLAIAENSEVRISPIPHLYAAGCDVGNVSNAGYLGGLATALASGRRAGQGAAACARAGDAVAGA